MQQMAVARNQQIDDSRTGTPGLEPFQLPTRIRIVEVDRPTVSVVIPTLNEARNLPIVLSRLPEGIDEVVIVDGFSTDGTPEVARRCRPDVVVVYERERRGKGAALRAGFAAATCDYVVMIDADGSTAPEEIPLHIAALDAGAEVVKGSRFMEGGGSSDITPIRRAGNAVVCGMTNILWGTHYTDLCYGFMAFRRTALERIEVDCDGFEVETLLGIRVAEAGFVVAEVPSMEHDRIHGESNLHVVRDGMRIARTMLRERFLRRSRRTATPAPALGMG